MAYTTIDDPTIYFNTKLYTGNGGTNAITGVGFQPDWVWVKRRDSSAAHYVWDVVRGAAVQLYPASASSEDAGQTNGLSAFGSDGFTLGSDAGANANSGTFASWNWKAGTSFTNDASATGIGSIDSAGSVNQDAGFSIIGYSGDTSDAPSTVAHGLSQKPEMMFIKRRTLSGQWVVYNKTIGATHNLHLDSTDASSAYQYFFNNTEPTSSVFTVGDDGESNKTGSNYIAYCFHSVQGYSKIGTYTGNGSTDGVFIYTGFKPAFTLIKAYSIVDKWSMFDAKRNPFNEVDNNIRANLSDAEVDQANKEVDYLSNGIKLRTSSGEWNSTGTQYIFMSFAESPFVTSTGVPTTAR